MARLVWSNPPEWIWLPAQDRPINMTKYAQDAQYKAEVDAIFEAGVNLVRDDARPCKGQNINICVGEGCFNNACIKDQLEKGAT